MDPNPYVSYVAPGIHHINTKVLGDFGFNYAKSMPTDDSGHDPTNINKFNQHQYNNTIGNQEVDEILLQENNKLIN